MFKDENRFNLNSSFTNVEQILQAVGRIQNAFDGFDLSENLQNLSYDSLDLATYEAEKIAISCRKNLDFVQISDEDFNSFGPILARNLDENLTKNELAEVFFLAKNYPVSVDFDGKILTISTPLTFKRFYRDGNLKENYTLMIYIREALIRWQEENNFDLFRSINAPFVLTIQRKIAKKKVNGVCDCDNLENNRIANEIMDALGNTDNSLVLSVFSTLTVTNDTNNTGMDFILCSKEDFPSVFSRL